MTKIEMMTLLEKQKEKVNRLVLRCRLMYKRVKIMYKNNRSINCRLKALKIEYRI